MKRFLFILSLLMLSFIIAGSARYLYGFSFFTKNNSTVTFNDEGLQQKLKSRSLIAETYAKQRGFNTNFCFLADMNIASGKNRFFVYDMKNDSVLLAGITAHGSCNYKVLTKAKFSNQPGCGCSAYGKYKVGYKYTGRFGTAYKLYGLDSSNSNAFDRFIVLHSYYLVPDNEVYPLPVCNSLGCVMVSDNFLKILSAKIDASEKPVLLWVYQ